MKRREVFLKKTAFFASIFTLPFFTFAADIDSLINAAAKRHEVDPVLVKAVISQESKFNERAIGKSGEIGLMQVKQGVVEDWAAAFNIPVPQRDEVFDAELNVEIGTWYLGRAVKFWKNGDYKHSLVLGLCEYNAGRGRMKEWLPSEKYMSADIKLVSTKEYVGSVLNKYFEYSFSDFMPEN